ACGHCRGTLAQFPEAPPHSYCRGPAVDDRRAIVDGQCDRAFEPVRDALAEALASGFEVGAALAVYVDGRPVIDVWGGYADAARTRRWQRGTIVNLYSVGEAVSAVCALRPVATGAPPLDAQR